MIILVCDKCGEKLIDKKKGGRELITLFSPNKRERWDLDLCEKCFEEIRSCITTYFGSPKDTQ